MIGGAKKGDDALQVWSFPTPTTTSTSFAFPSTLDDRYPHFPTTAAKVNLLTFDSNFPSFSFSYAMSPIQESLLSTLDKAGLSDEDALNALEEFAWTSIVQGKRVRDYCEDLTEVLGQITRPAWIQKLLGTGTLTVLFPFVRIASPHFPSSPPYPQSLCSSTCLSTITRKQLIDSLVKVSRQTSQPRDVLYTEGLIFELVLEYVGKKWRTEQGDVVEIIAKKLTEVEFETQIQGDLDTVRSTIHPALQKARFFLGFLSSSQLVARLNASSHASRPDPEHLVRSFITRRLASGSDPTVVVLDLLSNQVRLSSASHKSTIVTTIASFGLHSDVPTPTEFGSPGHAAYEPSSPSPTANSFGPTISPRRATFSKLANKWASKRPLPVPAAPKWLTHRKNLSYSAKIAVPGFNPDRRPSLPTLPSAPLAGTFVHAKSPLSGSTTSFQTTLPIREENQEWEDVGTEPRPTTKDELLLQLLRLRYRVSREGGWYLGRGTIEAGYILDHCHVDADDITDLRILFGMCVSQPSTPSTVSTFTSTSPVADTESNSLNDVDTPTRQPPLPASFVQLSTASEASLVAPRRLISPMSFASFDLEEYYARIASQSSHTPKLSLTSITTSVEHSSDSQHTFTQASQKGRRRRSTGVESHLSDATFQTGFTYGRGSRMSAFSIHQATHEWPIASPAYLFNIPPNANDNDHDPSSSQEEEVQEVLQPYPQHRHTRSRSETDLLALIGKPSSLSPLPPRPSSLRRSRRCDPLLQTTLSAYRLGHPSPHSAHTPTLVPDLHLQSASDDANHSHTDFHSLLISNIPRPPISPPQSPDSSRFNTPLPGAFPLPPDGHPSFRDPLGPIPSFRSRSANRQYTVINGHVSPSKVGDHDDGKDYFERSPTAHCMVNSLSKTSENSTASSTASNRFRDKALPVPPRTSSLRSLRRPGEPVSRPMSGNPDTPLSLALSLFEISKLPPLPDAPEDEQGTHIITPKRELTVDDVNIVLGDMVDNEKSRIKSRGKRWDDAARCRVGWLMDQVGDLLNDPQFQPIIDVHLDRLAPASHKSPHLDRLSPASSTGSQRPLPKLQAISPLVMSRVSLLGDEDDSPPIPQSSPRPPPRPLVRAISPQAPNSGPPKPTQMVPLSPPGKPPSRPLPARPKTRGHGSKDSGISRPGSKMSMSTFGH